MSVDMVVFPRIKIFHTGNISGAQNIPIPVYNIRQCELMLLLCMASYLKSSHCSFCPDECLRMKGKTYIRSKRIHQQLEPYI